MNAPTPPNKGQSRIVFGSILLLLSVTSAGSAENATNPENSLKAALIYKIMAYVTWPESAFQDTPGGAFTVCGYGEQPLDGALDTLTQRQAAGRSIDLVNLSDEEPFTDTCHLLFVDAESDIRAAIELTGQQPVLTISDARTFAQSGGMIEIRKNRNRFGFLINRTAAVDSGLLIAAPLLELSTVVRSKR